MPWTPKQIGQLVHKYPYIAPHNSWTGSIVEGYDCTYTEAWALPEGWHRLFYLLCKHLYPHLESSGIVSDFYFTEVKEKCGTMRAYVSAIPESATRIVDLFECFSKQICQRCGNYATYTTYDWVEHLCAACSEGTSATKDKRRKNTATFRYFRNNKEYCVQYSLRAIHNEYESIKNLTDEQFLEYLLN